MKRASLFIFRSIVVASAAICSTLGYAGLVVLSAERDFSWGTGGTVATQDVDESNDAYSNTVSGITQASTAITDSGFTMTTSASSPTAGVQWTQYGFLRFQFTEDTAITLSGTLFSLQPDTGNANGYQYVYLQQFGGPMLLDVTNSFGLDVVGPQAYTYSGTLTANTVYLLEANNAWTTSADGFNGTFLSLAVAVPEPSTFAMAFAGLACGGYLLFRRRRAC